MSFGLFELYLIFQKNKQKQQKPLNDSIQSLINNERETGDI